MKGGEATLGVPLKYVDLFDLQFNEILVKKEFLHYQLIDFTKYFLVSLKEKKPGYPMNTSK